MTTELTGLATLGNLPADYRHHPKLVRPAEDLVLPNALLKWYDVYQEGAAVSAELRSMARDFLAAEVDAGALRIDGELGFVVHHLCGESFYFLIVCTWRHCNEMWETLYARDAKDGGAFALVPQGTHMEIICVWELGAVLHEQQAWTRYLYSARDEQAKLAYVNDRFTGTV